MANNILPIATATSNSPICAGTTLNLTGGPSELTSYAWSGPNEFMSSMQSPIVSTDATSAMAGEYRLIVTNSFGCLDTATTTVVVKTVPTITETTPADRCGPGTLTLGAYASAGAINWYAASVGGESLGTGISFITPSLSVTTTYYVDATNEDCTTTERTAVVATVNPIPSIYLESNQFTVCKGTTSVDIYQGSGIESPIQYAITQIESLGESAYLGEIGSPNQYSITFSESALTQGFVNVEFTTFPEGPIQVIIPPDALAGSYDFVLIVKNSITGCQSEGLNLILTISPMPTATTSIVNVSCKGSSDGSITVTPTSGAGNYTYSLSPGSHLGGPQPEPYTFTGLAPNSYTWSMTNSQGCVVTGQESIIEPTLALNATLISNQISCKGAMDGTISIISPIGGYGSYEYTINGGTTWSTTSYFTALAPAVYVVQMRDATFPSCIFSLNEALIIAEPEIPEAPIVGEIIQPTCLIPTGSVTLSGLPEGSYVINPVSINGSTTSNTITELAVGTYNFSYTTNQGCLSKSSVDVVIRPQPDSPDVPVVKSIAQPTCLVASGSVTFSGLPQSGWTINPGGFSGTTAETTITGLETGTHNYTLTNSRGCVSMPSADVVILPQPFTPTAPMITVINQPSCEIATGTVTLEGLPEGAWTINPGNLTGSTTTTVVSGLLPGAHQFTVINSVGCLSALSTVVTIDAYPIHLELASTATTCNGSKDGTINLVVTCGTAPYSFAWTGPNGFTSTVQNLTGVSGGFYTVSVVDNTGLNASASVTVDESLAPIGLSVSTVAAIHTMSIDGTTILGQTPGSVDLLVVGGTQPYSFVWTGPNSFAATTEDLTDLVGGTYQVVVTDKYGCTATIIAVVDLQVVLSEDQTCVLVIPNVFTPNADGIHDYFEISCLYNYANAEVQIFNRNGNLVFKRDHYGNLDFWGSKEKAFWNGRSENSLNFMGSELPSGTYYYILKLGIGTVRTGFVFLGR